MSQLAAGDLGYGVRQKQGLMQVLSAFMDPWTIAYRPMWICRRNYWSSVRPFNRADRQSFHHQDEEIWPAPGGQLVHDGTNALDGEELGF